MSDTTVLGPDGKEYPTGDLEPLLHCHSCGELLPLSDFHFSARDVQRLQRASQCKRCRARTQRDRRQGIPKVNRRTVAKQERQTKVVDLLDKNYPLTDMAEILGVSYGTIVSDLRELGLNSKHKDYVRDVGAAPPKPNVTVADNAIRQLAEMASLIHDGSRVTLQLEGLPISPDMAADWEKRLAHVGKALRYLRSHAKKGNTQ